MIVDTDQIEELQPTLKGENLVVLRKGNSYTATRPTREIQQKLGFRWGGNSPARPRQTETFQSGGAVEVDLNLANSEDVNIYSRRDGDTVPPYVDNPESFRDKPEPREYKAVFVVTDQEVSQFSDEITLNSARLV